jgi:hypothetical protein
MSQNEVEHSCGGSAGHNRRGERRPMILRPGWTEGRPRTVEYLVRTRPQDTSRFSLDVLGVVDVDAPAASAPDLGQRLAIHDRVGSAFVGRAALDCDRLWKVGRPGPNRHRDDRSGKRGRKFVERRRRRAFDRRSYVGHQRRERIVVEGLCRAVEEMGSAHVMDRCRGQAGFDQLDPPTVNDLVISRRGHNDGPAEVVGDAESHANDSASGGRSDARGARRHMPIGARKDRAGSDIGSLTRRRE